ncbi:hypothetical protein NQ314_012859 [Rhamnusium bicolor]|uniref:Uncharacterized protein n=1 Tax=Rhamnusium bicolor TaxID=1586634 RepID=A0AAV8XA69_9CUCU|nr:hypothetical protein NQ314_012859 [Rhamnusium bicolor]
MSQYLWFINIQKRVKKPNTKRALFMSPSKNSPLKNSPFKRSPFKRLDLGMEKKRKRSESDDTHPPKLSRTTSMNIRPSESEVKTKFNKAKSDVNISLNRSQAGQSGELSAIHKKVSFSILISCITCKPSKQQYHKINYTLCGGISIT